MLNKEIAKKVVEISTEIQKLARRQHTSDRMTDDDYQGTIEGQLLKLVHVVTEKVKEKYNIDPKPGLTIMISDLHDWKAYFINDKDHAKCKTDKSVYETVLNLGQAVTMGKITGTPIKNFTPAAHEQLKKYGYNKLFKI